MDSSTVDNIEKIGSFLDNLLGAISGGWATVAAAGSILLLFTILILWLKWKERKARIERARRETEENQIEDQTTTVEENQQAEENWEDAENEIDEIRRRQQTGKKKRQRRTQ